jgi:Skp family chaperone for outer membrane proteins
VWAWRSCKNLIASQAAASNSSWALILAAWAIGSPAATLRVSTRLQAQERAEQLEQERARLEAEHRRAEEEAAALRAELEAERSKGFWARLFGG